MSPPVPSSASLDVVSNVVHELAHAPLFALGDEYGTDNPLAPTTLKVTTNPNIQEESSVRVVTPVPIGPQAPPRFDPALIKWSWPRIEAAGVLTAQPAPSPPPAPGLKTYDLSLGLGHAFFFKKGDTVRLRTRPLLTSKTSQLLTVLDTSPMVGTINVLDITLTMTPADFPAGSIVFRPKRAVAAPNAELSLVAPRIAAHLLATNNPLNVPPGAGGAVCVQDKNVDMRARNIPAAIATQIATTQRPKWGQWLVGLFEGGGGYGCGVYHPTGTCLLRALRIQGSGLYQFCTVCRYVLVDVLDPSLHGEIDARYDPRYPDP